MNPENTNQLIKIMRITKYLSGATALAALMTGTVANAAITVTSQSSASRIAFDDTGTEIGGVSFTTTGTYDGILFNQWTPVSTFQTPKTIGGSVTAVFSAGVNATTSVISNAGSQQYTTIAYTSGNGAGTLTISGLDINKQYLIQYGFHDNRDGSYPYETIATLTLSDTTFASQPMSFGATGTADDYELVAAQVSGTTSLALFMPVDTTGTTTGPHWTSFSVHVIPEPSTALLGGLGLLVLLRRRR